MLEKYANISEILDDYIDYLEGLCQWYINVEKELMYGDYCEALSHQYGQHFLLKTIFCSNDQNSPYLTYGTSSGRPWCQFAFAKMPMVVGDLTLYIRLFYRTDYKEKGKVRLPYVSLRQYVWFKDKNEDKERIKERKKEDFYILRELFNNTLVEFPELVGIEGGNNGGYFESEFGVFYLKDNDFETLRKLMLPFHSSLMAKIMTTFPQSEDSRRYICK